MDSKLHFVNPISSVFYTAINVFIIVAICLSLPYKIEANDTPQVIAGIVMLGVFGVFLLLSPLVFWSFWFVKDGSLIQFLPYRKIRRIKISEISSAEEGICLYVPAIGSQQECMVYTDGKTTIKIPFMYKSAKRLADYIKSEMEKADGEIPHDENDYHGCPPEDSSNGSN